MIFKEYIRNPNLIVSVVKKETAEKLRKYLNIENEVLTLINIVDIEDKDTCILEYKKGPKFKKHDSRIRS